MKKNKKAVSLIIAILIVLVSTLLAYTILEYMIPFQKNIGGIENAAKSYYYANGGIEKGLYFFSNREDKYLTSDTNFYCTKTGCTTSNVNYTNPNIRYGSFFSTISTSKVLPRLGEGDSDYKDGEDWNTISMINPIQLQVGYNFVDIDDFDITFRIPEKNTSLKLDLSTGYIFWQLSSASGTLNSMNDYFIKGGSINNSDKITNLSDKKGYSYTELSTKLEDISLKNAFNNNTTVTGTPVGSVIIGGNTISGFDCTNPNNWCYLTFTVINRLKAKMASIEVPLPYLEWQIKSSNPIPLRYSVIESGGKSNGFGRKLKVRYSQTTLNAGFTFGVIQ